MNRNLTYSIDNGGGASTLWNVIVVIIVLIILGLVALLCYKIVRKIKYNIEMQNIQAEKERNRELFIRDVCEFIKKNGNIYYLRVCFNNSGKSEYFLLWNMNNKEIKYTYRAHGYADLNENAAQNVFSRIAQATACHYHPIKGTRYYGRSNTGGFIVSEGLNGNYYVSSIYDGNSSSSYLEYIELFSNKAWNERSKDIEAEKTNIKNYKVGH